MRRTLRGRSLPLFAAFVLFNALGSYAPLPLSWRILGGGLFLAGLLALAFASARRGPRESPPRLPDPPRGAFLLSAALLALALLFRPASFSAWPAHDEGVSALYAVDNMNGWDGRLSYHYSALPPLPIWIVALSFRVLGPGPLGLWLPPALLGFASALLLSSTARRLGGPAFALLALALAGFGFWGLEAARFSHPYILVLFWGALSLRVAIWATEPQARHRSWRAFTAGACTGAGFLTFFSWPVVAAALFGITLLRWRGTLRHGALRTAVTAWAIPFLLFSLPTLHGLASGAYQGHAAGLLNLSIDANGLLTRFANVTTLFWTGLPMFLYGPFLGGFLNPLEGACVFLGFLGLARVAHPWRALGGAAALFLLLLLPGLATLPLNLTRTIQLAPPLYLLAALGLARLLSSTRRPWRWAALLLVLSASWNLYHLWGPVRDWCTKPSLGGIQRDIRHAEAWRLLSVTAAQRGPGAVLLMPGLDAASHRPGSMNPSLLAWTRPFDVTGRDGSPAPSWTALLAPARHAPYLSRRFPQGTWTHLPHPPGGDAGDLVLGLLPGNALREWSAAESSLRELYRRRLSDPDTARDPAAARARYAEGLASRKAAFAGDPFLRAIYLEQQYSANGGDRRALEEALRQSYRSPLLESEARRLRPAGRGR
jgi:hypothetical protein